jgi:hypothetical protein
MRVSETQVTPAAVNQVAAWQWFLEPAASEERDIGQDPDVA